MYYIKKTFEVSACHRLTLSYESKCERLHGHNWIITVYCKSDTLNADGMVVDFTHIKQKIQQKLDHANLNEVLPFNRIFDGDASHIITYGIEAEYYYLQPCDVGDAQRNAHITAACIAYIEQHPEWRLSLQTHKLIGFK